MSTARTSQTSRGSVGALMVALLSACIAFQLNASMLSPALAAIQNELGVTTADVGLTQTAFFTAAALFSLFLPRLGDLVGRKRVLTAMLALMVVGCVIAALASNIGLLFAGSASHTIANHIEDVLQALSVTLV